MSHLVTVIARKELTEMLRDGRFRVLGALVVLLVLAASAFGWRQSETIHRERADAAGVARGHWEAQGEKNPHVAAHYGVHVFKPTGALSLLDPGVEPYLGVSVELQAHARALATDAAARDATGIQRFGQLSVALVLQLLVPLLIIALGFGSWTSEREGGTLRQLASLGLGRWTLLAGKALGLIAALSLLLIPVAVIVGGGLALSGTGLGTNGGLRLLGFIGAYAVYFGVFAGLTLAASAVSRSSRAALVALVGFWGLTTLVVPRVAGELAAEVSPLPSAEVFARAVARDLEHGLEGSEGREARVAEITVGMMKERGFEGADFFMGEAMMGGIELQAEAAFEDEILDHHFSGLMDAVARQERGSAWASAASPATAVRMVSMALSGTDFAHHRAFAESAEKYRRELIRLMNDDFAENAGAAGWDYKAGPELWAKAPAFSYDPPTLGWSLAQQPLGLGMLAAWLAVAILAAALAARRLRIT